MFYRKTELQRKKSTGVHTKHKKKVKDLDRLFENIQSWGKCNEKLYKRGDQGRFWRQHKRTKT